MAARALHVAVGRGALAGERPEARAGGVHAQRAGDDAAPALGGLDGGGEVEVGAPEGHAAWVFEDGALEDAEGAGLGGVRGRVVDVEAAAALGAEALEGALPGDVGEEVGGFGAGGEDLVLEVGALVDEGADFVLLGRGVSLGEGGRMEGLGGLPW